MFPKIVNLLIKMTTGQLAQQTHRPLNLKNKIMNHSIFVLCRHFYNQIKPKPTRDTDQIKAMNRDSRFRKQQIRRISILAN